jgi:tripartite-type tricarboxylate transporter receptor subunit TctC
MSHATIRCALPRASFGRRTWPKNTLRALLLFALAWTPIANADNYPSKPIKIIVPFAAGGSMDTLARLFGEKLKQAWGQPVIVDNRPGATGIIGTTLAAQAPADGYTLLMVASATMAINPSVFRKLPYDPLKDFAPIMLFVDAPILLVAHPSVRAQSVKELIALAKAQPGELSFASAGNGSSQHLAGELFKSMAGIDITHVAYKGSTPAIADLLGGQVSLMFDVMPTVIGHVKAGKLKAIAAAGAKRSPLLPEIPTVAEAGLAGYEAHSWYGIAAPAKTPPALIDKLHAQFKQALRTPQMRNRLLELGLEPVGNTPQEFSALIRSEQARYAKLVKISGVRAD